MFCLGGGGAGQKLQADIQIRRGTLKLRWGGPARAGLARPGPGGTFNKGPGGPETLLQVLRRTGGGGILIKE